VIRGVKAGIGYLKQKRRSCVINGGSSKGNPIDLNIGKN
jgi:hypothetical protein